MRLILAAVCCIAGGATVTFVLSSEQQITERRASARVFDQRAREATEALAGVRTAQQAYVAAGKGVAFWMSKVDATMETVANTLGASALYFVCNISEPRRPGADCHRSGGTS